MGTKPAYLTELEEGLKAVEAGPHDPIGVALLVKDAQSRRLLQSASMQMDLKPTVLDEVPDAETLASYEVIVADEEVARQARKLLRHREEFAESVRPAVIAVKRAQEEGVVSQEDEDGFDGVLTLPMPPAAVAEQLSLIVYAHRAFARRYQTALEELHLNRRIFRSVTSGISVANATLPDLPLVYVNPAFEVMTGYRLEDVQGQNCRFLQGAEHDQPGVAALREAIAEEREVVALLKNFRRDGQMFWNELSLSPIRNREGELTHFVGIQTDVTARVEFEAALRESEKLAAVGRLASSIAHEINNPLESVMNLLYLAQGETEADDVKRYVAMADRELKRVALITSQSLRFYKQSTLPQSVDVTELLDSVLDMYASKAENSGVGLERRDRLKERVVCLESEVRQVLNNLIRNSLDAMHGKGGRLLLRTRATTSWKLGRRGALITVADTGSGISRETREKMYKPFFTTKGIAGTGLGLWISREIVLRHGGLLEMRSSQAAGRSGTVFELFLPFEVQDP